MADPVPFSLLWARFLLQVPEKEHTMDWAHDLCSTTRDLHVDVWAGCFDVEFVRTEILGVLLRDAVAQLHRKWSKTTNKGNRALLAMYEANTKDRAAHIKNRYLAGDSPAFPPDSKLRELANQAFEGATASGLPLSEAAATCLKSLGAVSNQASGRSGT